MKEEFKRIVDFKFNDNTLNRLVETLQEQLKGSAFEGHVFLKGNAIRNQLLKVPINPKDIEVVVDKPQGAISFSTWLAWKQSNYVRDNNPVLNTLKGEAVVKVQVKGIAEIKVNCVQTKMEYSYDEESTPTVNYAEIQDSAKISGLTIDALYYNISDGCLYDYTGYGFNDIENNIIRVTDDKHVFKDDPRKILYALRMASELNFGIEKNTWISILSNSNRLGDMSAVLVREELDKILLSPTPSQIIRKMFVANCLDNSWPHLLEEMELVNQPFTRSDSIYEHTLSVVDKVPAKLEVRIAALFHDIGKLKSNDDHYVYHELVGSEMTETIMKLMGYSDNIIDKVLTMIERHEDLDSLKPKEVPSTRFVRRFKRNVGDQYENVLALIDANNKSQSFGKRVNQVKNFKAAAERYAEKENKASKNRELNNTKSTLPIDGNDIKKELGIKSGPIIGLLLDRVKHEYGKRPNITKEECMMFCRAMTQMMS